MAQNSAQTKTSPRLYLAQGHRLATGVASIVRLHGRVIGSLVYV